MLGYPIKRDFYKDTLYIFIFCIQNDIVCLQSFNWSVILRITVRYNYLLLFIHITDKFKNNNFFDLDKDIKITLHVKYDQLLSDFKTMNDDPYRNTGRVIPGDIIYEDSNTISIEY